EAGVQLNAEQADWKDDIDDESKEQELEAHYITQDDQDDTDDLDQERDLLASLIQKLKCEIDDITKTKINFWNHQTRLYVTPPKSGQRSGIPLGVLLHNTQR
ncbi:hypothetical protein Tco_0176062, partial [Tanacetum coccineum]